MMQSVEALLDDALAASVRDEWQALLDAGLPSQARHTGATNAPHVTLAVASTLGADAEDRLDAAVPDVLPALTLGGLLVFPGGVLARAVVPAAPLLALHRRLLEAVGEEPGVVEHVRPDRWTPHVTLARRLPTADLGAAVDALSDVPRERSGRLAEVRRWDPRLGEAWSLPR